MDDSERPHTEEASQKQLVAVVFRDLLDHGLFKVGEYAIFIGGPMEAAEIRMFIDGGAVPPLKFVDVNRNGGGVIVDGAIDFTFTVDGFLRLGGVAALRFSSAIDPVIIPPNFKMSTSVISMPPRPTRYFDRLPAAEATSEGVN